MNLQRLFAMLVARNREFLRDRMALSWNIILPVMIVMGFAFAFSAEDPNIFKVGVLGEDQGTESFLTTAHIQFIGMEDRLSAFRKVERHQLDMLLDLENTLYWVNENSSNGYFLERLLEASSSKLQKQSVSGDPIRYVDWLIPGVLGMNVMFSSLFGVGFVIVRYRKNGVLKRLKATPLTPLEFLTAQILSRLWLILLVSTLVYSATDIFIGFRMNGSYLVLLLILAAGTLSMISLGLIVAARLANEEVANGLLNVVSWPMMLLSGVWFSLDGSPAIVQHLAQLLPLTHLTAAARAVMIDGAGLGEIAWHLLVMLAMTVIFTMIGAKSFRWE